MRDIYILVLKIFGTAQIFFGLLAVAAAQFMYFGGMMDAGELFAAAVPTDMMIMGKSVYDEKVLAAMQQATDDLQWQLYVFISVFCGALPILLGVYFSMRNNLFVRLQYGLARRPYELGPVAVPAAGPSVGQASTRTAGASPDFSRYAPPE